MTVGTIPKPVTSSITPTAMTFRRCGISAYIAS